MKNTNYFFVAFAILSLQSCSFMEDLMPSLLANVVIGAVILCILIIAGLLTGTFKKGASEKTKMENGEKRAKDYFRKNPAEWDEIARIFNDGTMTEIDSLIDNIVTMNLTASQKEVLVEYSIYVLKYKQAINNNNEFTSRKDKINEILKEIRQR